VHRRGGGQRTSRRSRFLAELFITPDARSLASARLVLTARRPAVVGRNCYSRARTRVTTQFRGMTLCYWQRRVWGSDSAAPASRSNLGPLLDHVSGTCSTSLSCRRAPNKSAVSDRRIQGSSVVSHARIESFATSWTRDVSATAATVCFCKRSFCRECAASAHAGIFQISETLHRKHVASAKRAALIKFREGDEGTRRCSGVFWQCRFPNCQPPISSSGRLRPRSRRVCDWRCGVANLIRR